MRRTSGQFVRQFDHALNIPVGRGETDAKKV
jgi:hypothetical protein